MFGVLLGNGNQKFKNVTLFERSVRISIDIFSTRQVQSHIFRLPRSTRIGYERRCPRPTPRSALSGSRAKVVVVRLRPISRNPTHDPGTNDSPGSEEKGWGDSLETKLAGTPMTLVFGLFVDRESTQLLRSSISNRMPSSETVTTFAIRAGQPVAWILVSIFSTRLLVTLRLEQFTTSCAYTGAIQRAATRPNAVIGCCAGKVRCRLRQN